MTLTRRDIAPALTAAALGATVAPPAEAAPQTGPLHRVRAIDYIILFARDMAAMRRFYGRTLGFPLHEEQSWQWIVYRVGGSLLALTERGGMFDDAPPPAGALSVQLAFRVAPKEVDASAAALAAAGVALVAPPTDQAWGHRTLFFRDPDGNVLEVYAEI